MNNPLVQLDPGLFIWTIVTFLVLLTLLAKFAWRPLLQALEERQALIRKSLDDAQQAKQELERVQHESAQVVARARVDADAIVSQSRSDAERGRSCATPRAPRPPRSCATPRSRSSCRRFRRSARSAARPSTCR
jgi:F0F1-type ATP synthase membrane subunit b/b'